MLEIVLLLAGVSLFLIFNYPLLFFVVVVPLFVLTVIGFTRWLRK